VGCADVAAIAAVAEATIKAATKWVFKALDTALSGYDDIDLAAIAILKTIDG
jgi:hypothetical protein